MFKAGIIANAHSIILGHNHPSQDVEPSPSDVSFTRRIVLTGRFLDLPVIDHLVVTSDAFRSLKAMGVVDAPSPVNGRSRRRRRSNHDDSARTAPGPKNETREQQVAALSRNLKGLAKDLDVHVLALAQLNAGHETRKGDEKRPRLGDLRESKAIANDADVVAFVHREDYQAERDDRDGRAPPRGFAEVIVAKQRGGRTGVARLVFDRARCRFEAAPDDSSCRGDS